MELERSVFRWLNWRFEGFLLLGRIDDLGKWYLLVEHELGVLMDGWRIVIEGFDAWNWGIGCYKNWGKCKVPYLIMRGRFQLDEDSSRSLKSSSSQHMRPVPPLATADNSLGDNHSAIASSITTSTTGYSFFKVLIWWVFHYLCLLHPVWANVCLWWEMFSA